MKLFSKKPKVVYALQDDEKQEVTQFLNRLKELNQNVIGTRAVLNATLQAIAVKAGITDFSKVRLDMDKMLFIEESPAQESVQK